MRLTNYIKDLGRVVAYYPNLKKITGSTTSSILLCQLLYWTDKTDDGWIRKTSDMIEEETGLTYNEQRTARDNLRELGIITDVYKRLDHEISFFVNQDVLNDLWEDAGGETLEHIEKKKVEKVKPKSIAPPPPPVSKKITPDMVNEAFERKEEEPKTIGKLYPRKEDFIDVALGEGANKANNIYEQKRYIAERIEKKLNLTDVMSSAKWIGFVDFAYGRKTKHNEDIDVFLNWTINNEAYNPAYWTPGKMRTLWSQAFVANLPDENFVKSTDIKVNETPEDEVVPPPRDMRIGKNLFGE